jgi:hypothetical protein
MGHISCWSMLIESAVGDSVDTIKKKPQLIDASKEVGSRSK